MSDVVAFTLMFGIILTSVGLVATFGLAELESFDSAQQLDNAERTFELVARSFEELEETQSTVRTEAVELSGGSITVSESSDLTVTVRDFDSGSAPNEETFDLNALVYETPDSIVGYENGATFRQRKQSDGGIINHEPGMICSDGTAVLSFVTVESSGEQLGGSGTERITGRLTNSTLLYPTATWGEGNASAADAVDLEFTFDNVSRAREWANHFDRSSGDWEVRSQTDSSVTIRCGASGDLDHVYVRESVIEVSYS